MSGRQLLLIAALFAASSTIAKPNKPPVAPASAKVCEECHGTNGVSTAPGVPHLNGQLADSLVEFMESFKNGKRPSSTPEHTNPALKAEEIAALAKYYSYYNAERAQRPAQPANAAKVAEAEPLYTRRCAKCHVDNGREAEHDAPLLAGQSLEYLQAQTTAFMTGKRKFPFLMDEAYDGLSKEDLERLSHFFAGQRQ